MRVEAGTLGSFWTRQAARELRALTITRAVMVLPERGCRKLSWRAKTASFESLVKASGSKWQLTRLSWCDNQASPGVRPIGG